VLSSPASTRQRWFLGGVCVCAQRRAVHDGRPPRLLEAFIQLAQDIVELQQGLADLGRLPRRVHAQAAQADQVGHVPLHVAQQPLYILAVIMPGPARSPGSQRTVAPVAAARRPLP
jgi:hypothetical protein